MCETLVGFITRIPYHLQEMKTEPEDSVKCVDMNGRIELDLDSGFDRPEIESDNTVELQRSYATVTVLTPKCPSSQYTSFLSENVSGI